MSTRPEHGFGFSPRPRPADQQAVLDSGSGIHRRAASLPMPPPNLSKTALASRTPLNGEKPIPEEEPAHILSNTSDTVKVLVRMRPPNEKERSHGYIRCVRQTSDETLQVTGVSDPQSFTFDYVAGCDVTQETLFKIAGAPIVETVLEGYNSCIFAYGQTGSGKTYTMLGDLPESPHYMPSSAGLTPRVIKHLFASMEEQKNGTFDVRCSLLEIYNETITDLLWPDATNLQVREDNKNGTYVEGLTEEPICSVEDAVDLMQRGAANRTIAETNMNTESSRSHCVMTLVIEGKVRDSIGTKNLFSRLNLVDLAGSERQRATGALGERLKEASSINKSLSALGHVIMSLADLQHGKGKHIPYRDSKLTFLLQDSLGGNAKTVMIANASPAKTNIGETLSTLRFARGAKKIKNKAVTNGDYGSDVEALQKEILRLKEELASIRRSPKPAAQATVTVPESSEASERTQQISRMGSFEFRKSPLAQTLSLPPRPMEKDLVASLKREKDKQEQLDMLMKEIATSRDIITAKENDLQKSRMIIKFRDDKIRRMEEDSKDPSSPSCASARELEVHNLEQELAMLKQQLEGPGSTDWSKHAIENSLLRERILVLEKSADPSFMSALEADVQSLCERCLILNQEVERYKMFDPAEVVERAHEAASQAVSLSSKRLEETMAKAAKAKEQAEEQARLVAAMKEEMAAERSLKPVQEDLQSAEDSCGNTDSVCNDMELLLSTVRKERDSAVDSHKTLLASFDEQLQELESTQETNRDLESANCLLEEKCNNLLSEIQRLEVGMDELMAVKLRLEESDVEGDLKILDLSRRLGEAVEEAVKKEQELVNEVEKNAILVRQHQELVSERNNLAERLSDTQNVVETLNKQLEQGSKEVDRLVEENSLIKEEKSRLQSEISQLSALIELKENTPTVALNLSIVAQEFHEPDPEDVAECSKLRARVLDLEAQCEDLTCRVYSSEESDSERIMSRGMDCYSEVSDQPRTPSSQTTQVSTMEFEAKLALLSDEVIALRDQLKREAKDKSDLSLLCNNLMEELDEKHTNVAMSLARAKALKDQVDRLQTENVQLLERANFKSVNMGIRVAGESESDRLREEIDDLKGDIARKDLSIKNMDVLLKGLLSENEKLKSKQTRTEELMDAAVQREEGLVQQVEAQDRRQTVLLERLNLSRSFMNRFKDSGASHVADGAGELNENPEYISEGVRNEEIGRCKGQNSTVAGSVKNA